MAIPFFRALALTFLFVTPPIQADIETIIVTASRTPVVAGDVGSAVSIISREDIERRGASSLADILRAVPGLSVSQQGSTGAITQVRARGAEANQLLVLIDGVEANDVAQGSEFNFAHVLLNDVERVEVVRGPQSALWGSDAMAGVVNIITQPTAPGTSGLTGYLGGGSFGTVAGGVSGNLQGVDQRLSFGLDHHETNGTNISRTGTERDGYENTTLRLGGNLRLSEDAGLSANARYTDVLSDFDGVDFLATGLPVDAPFQTDSRQFYGRVGADVAISEQIEQIVGLTRTHSHNINHTDATVPDVSIGSKNALHLQTNVLLGRQTLTLVLEHEREDYEQRGLATFFGDPNKSHKANTTSAALELRHDGDLINASASVRHDNNSEFDDALTWRLTTLVHLSPTTGVFAAAGKSIKNPTFTERFGFFDSFFGNPALAPEESNGWELGLRQSLFTDALSLSASYYQARLKSEILGFVFDPDLGGFTAANSGDDSDRKGFEVEFAWQASQSFSVQGSYTWLNSEDATAVSEIRRPRNSGALRFNYGKGRLNLNVGFDVTGEQTDDYFPPFPPFQERVVLDGYVLMNVAAQYHLNESVTLTARVENALDEGYEEVFGFRSPGRGVYGGVRVSF